MSMARWYARIWLLFIISWLVEYRFYTTWLYWRVVQWTGKTMNNIHLQQRTTNIRHHHLQLNVNRFAHTKFYYNTNRKLFGPCQRRLFGGHLPALLSESDWRCALLTLVTWALTPISYSDTSWQWKRVSFFLFCKKEENKWKFYMYILSRLRL